MISSERFSVMQNSILALLSRRPMCTARQIAAELRVEKSEVNSLLYRLFHAGFVEKLNAGSESAPLWRATTRPSVPPLAGADERPSQTVEHEGGSAVSAQTGLYRWQEDALDKWRTEGYRGMVEAVTGSGKTRLALEAAKRLRKAINQRLYTVVVVPTITLMDQWYSETEKFFGTDQQYLIGRLGDGHQDDFSRPRCSMIIAVAPSAANHVNNLLAFARNGNVQTLIIADEVHRLIYAEQHGRVLDYPFTYTLGMSATLDKERDDRIGRRFYRFTFEDAKRDGIIPDFDLVQVAVSLNSQERREYEQLTDQLQDQFKLVKGLYATELKGIDEVKLEWRLLRELSRIQRRTSDPQIGRLFGQLFRRAAISHKCEQKIQLAKQLGHFFIHQQGRGKRIFFFERIQSAVEIEDTVEDRSVTDSFQEVADTLHAIDPDAWCKTVQSGLNTKDRRRILDEFRSSAVATLLCCRMLDEGLNVPEIDVAVLVSSSQTKRQRIQRIGRALRRSSEGKRPLVISFYVSETTDANTIKYDHELFAGVATIHSVSKESLINHVQELSAPRQTKLVPRASTCSPEPISATLV